MSRNKFKIGSTTEDLHDARLPDSLGTAGQVPKIKSDGTGFEYGDAGGMTNPMTEKGDLIIGGSLGNPTRLALGTSGQVLTSDGSGDMSWHTVIATQTVTIAVADWNGGTTCGKNVTGVTADNVVICDSSNADVQCDAQTAGYLRFVATTTPTSAVTVKVVILG